MVDIGEEIKQRLREYRNENPEYYKEMNSILIRLSAHNKKSPERIISDPVLDKHEKEGKDPEKYLEELFGKNPIDFYLELGYEKRLRKMKYI